MLFCKTHDLVWEIIIVSEKRMKNYVVKIIDNVFEKNDEGVLFPLSWCHYLYLPLGRSLSTSSM